MERENPHEFIERALEEEIKELYEIILTLKDLVFARLASADYVNSRVAQARLVIEKVSAMSAENDPARFNSLLIIQKAKRSMSEMGPTTQREKLLAVLTEITQDLKEILP